VTLGRLVLAGIVVAAWFGVATVATIFVMVRVVSSHNAVGYIGLVSTYLKQRLLEAAVVTMIASLWFDSLGSGEWWLLFLLFGLLVSCAKWFPPAPFAVTKLVRFAEIICDVARYLGAGALLAWRLS
jgi:hypothetical protein